MFSLNTNAENIKSELEEVIKPFGESLEVVHNLTKLKDGEINEITVNGKNYTFTDYFKANDILEEKRHFQEKVPFKLFL